MEPDTAPLTSVQQQVIDALAAGASLCDTADAHKIHRTTVYRWSKTIPRFKAALDLQRAELALGHREALQTLSNCALESLMQILANPKASPSIIFKTAKFILERNQPGKSGWSMAESSAAGNAEPRDSAAAEGQSSDVVEDFILNHEEEIVPEPPPEPAACNTMQHENVVSQPDVASGHSAGPSRLSKVEALKRVRELDAELMQELQLPRHLRL